MSPRISASRAFLASAAVLLATAPLTRGQTLWAGATTGSTLAWNTTANWAGGVVPNGTTASADLRIDWTGSSGNTLLLGSAITLNSLLYDDTGASGDQTLTLGNGGTAGNTLTFAGTTPTVSVLGPTLSITAVVAGSFTKAGAGALALSGSNTGLTSVTISEGTIRLGNNAALGSATLTFLGGGLSSSATTARSISNAFTLSGNVTLGNSGSTLNGALTLSGAGSLGGGTRTVTVASQVTLSGALSNGSLTKAGNGTLILSGSNTGLTGLTVDRNSGIVRVTSAAALGGSSTTVTINKEQTTESGQLQLATTGDHTFSQNWGSFRSAGTLGSGGSAHIRNNSGNNTITKTLNLGGTGGNGLVLESAGTAAGDLLTLAGNITSTVTSGRTLSIGGAGNGVISGIISNQSSTNTVGLEKSGAGTWTLSGANTFSGPVSVLGGTLAIGAGGASGLLGAGTSSVALSSGATLRFNVSADRTHSGAFSGAGNLEQAGPGLLTLTGTVGYTGNTTVSGGGLVALGKASLPGWDTPGKVSVTGTGALVASLSGWTLPEVYSLVDTTTFGSSTAAIGIDTAGTDATLATPFSKDVSLAKLGAGTLTLGASGIYTGTRLGLWGGTLRLPGGANPIAASTDLSFHRSATLDLNGGTQDLASLVTPNGGVHDLAVVGGAGSALNLSGSTNLEVGPGGFVDGTRVTMDLSALASFSFTHSNTSAGTFRVGPKGGSSNNAGLGLVASLTLAGTNVINAANFLVADVSANSDGGLAVLSFGAANTVNANLIAFGYSNRSDASVGFASGLVDPTLRLRGRDGASAVANLRLGNVSQFGGAGQTSFLSEADFSAGILDALVTTMWVGSADIGSSTGRVGTQVGRFTMGRGTLAVDQLVLGRLASSGGSVAAAMSATGEFTLAHADGLLAVTDLALASNTMNATGSFAKTAQGVLNLVAGTVRATDIRKGVTATQADTATINWTSGTIGNLAGTDLTVGANLVINLLDGTHILDAAGANSLTVLSPISGGFGIAKTGAGNLILAAANTYTGPTAVSEGTLTLGPGGSLASGAVVDLAAGARMSTAAGSALGANQTLRVGGLGAIAAAELGDFTLAGGTLAFDIASAASGDRLTLAAGATLTLDAGTLSINPLAGSLANGDYDLIDHAAGSLGGLLAGDVGGLALAGIASSGSRQSVTLADTGSVLRLSITGSAASLTWVGSTDLAYPNAWRIHDPVSDLPNWSANGTVQEGTLGNEFYQGDAVAFAGAGAGVVEVDDALVAGAVAVSGDADYTFAGTGSVAAASLSKSGSGKSTFGVALSTIGGATLAAGELELAAESAHATDIAVGGGTLRLSGGSVGAVTLAAGTVIVSGSGSPASVTATGGLVDVQGASTLGTGTVALSGATLRLGSVDGLGSGVVSLSSTRLELAGSGAFEKAFSALSDSTLAVTGAGTAVTRSIALLPASGALTLEVAEADASLALSAAHAASGDLTLTKTGSGALKLTAANTVGAVAVSAGTLFLGDNTAAGSVSGPVSVAAGATLRIHRSGTTLANQGSGALSGQGDVEWVGNNTGTGNLGAGSYALAVANTHSGTTRLTGARANISNAAALGTSAVEVGAAGQVFYTVSATPLANAVRVTSGTGWGDTGSTGTFGAIRLGTNASMSGDLVLAADGIRISGNNSTYSGVISEEGGSRGLEVNNPTFGLGTVTLSGANTFTGPVTINRNTLSVASLNRVVGGVAASNLGAPVTAEGGVITIGSAASGADFTYTGAGETTDRVVNLAAVSTGSSTLNANGSGLLRFTSAFTAAAGSDRSLILSGTGSGQLDAPLAGAEGFTLALTKSGAGSWTLLGANTLAGGVTVSGGSLTLSGDNTISSLTQSGASTVTTLAGANTFTGTVTVGSYGNGGGTLVVASDNALQGVTTLGVANSVLRSSDATARTLAAAISVNDHSTFGSADTGDLLLTGAVNLGSVAKNLTIANAVTEFSGVLFRTSGTATTQKLGAGKLLLSGANTYTGTLEVREGVVELAGAGKLGDTGSGLTLSGGSLDLGGTSQTVGAVSISAGTAGATLANGTLAGSSFAVSNAADTVTISASLGTGALTKTGAGALVLSGASTLGGLTLSAGSLDLGGASHTAGAVSLSAAAASGDTLSNGTLTGTSYAVSNTSGTLALSANLGTGTLTKTGAGTLVLSGSNALTGLTINNNSGTVRVTSLAALGTGTLSVLKAGTNSGTLELALAGANVIANPWGGFNSSTSTTAGTPGVATLRSVSGRNTLSSELVLTGTGGSGINLESAGTAAGDLLILAGGIGSTVATGRTHTLHGAGDGLVSGAISNVGEGPVFLYKDGTGTWTLSGDNTHRGPTIVFRGTLVAASPTALGTAESGSEVRDGATLALDGSLALGAESLILRGTGVAGAGALRSSGGDTSLSGGVSLASAATVNVADGSLEFSGIVSNTGRLTKAGAGTLVLSGANTHTGGTTLSAGTLRLGSGSALGSGGLTLAGGATLDLNGQTVANTLTFLADAAATLRSDTGSATLSGSLGLSGGQATLLVNDGDLTLSGAVSGTGQLVKQGAGLLILSGSNAFSGGTTLSAGTLRLGSLTALGSGLATVGSGATLELNGFAAASPLSVLSGGILDLGSVDYAGNLSLAPGATVNGTGRLTFAGAVDLDGVTLAPGITLGVASGGGIDFGAAAFAGEIQYQGGDVVGSGFTGLLVVSGEAVSLGGGIAAGTVKLTAGNGATVGAGFNRAILYEGGSLAGLDSPGFAALVTVGAGASLDVDLAGDIASTRARYRVLAGSALRGAALFESAVEVDGLLAPGNSPGIMEFADGLTLGATSVTEWEFDPAIDVIGVDPGANTDLLVVSGGDFTLAAGAVLKVVALGEVDYAGEPWSVLREFTVVTLTGAASFASAGSFALDTSEAGLFEAFGAWSIRNGDSDVTLLWTPAAIPEPSTYGLILGGLALASVAVRRRRKG